MDALYLPRFQEALKAHGKSLTTGTYWRYLNGMLPAFGVMLVERPDLAKALAEDAMDIAQKRNGATADDTTKGSTAQEVR